MARERAPRRWKYKVTFRMPNDPEGDKQELERTGIDEARELKKILEFRGCTEVTIGPRFLQK